MRRPHPGFGGFTLIETVVALASFVLLAGGVFAVIGAATEVAATLQAEERRQRQVQGLFELVRRSLADLPPAAGLRAQWNDALPEPVQELVLGRVPLALSWGSAASTATSATIASRPDSNGRYAIAISRPDFDPYIDPLQPDPQTTLLPDELGRYWLALLHDLTYAHWRFYDPRIGDWVETWQQAERPPLVELTLYVGDQPDPVRGVFPIPVSRRR